MKVEWKDNFTELYAQRGQQKYGIRLLALAKIQEGWTETKVCEFLNKMHNTIRSWRKLYEQGGLERLMRTQEGRGRKTKLPGLEMIKTDIELMHCNRTGGRVRCQDIVDMVAQKYNVRYSIKGMYPILHRLGFSWITSRSAHPKNDIEAQETFKKTLYTL